MSMNLVLGVDFGSESVRTVVVDCDSGKTLAADFCVYPRFAQELYCDSSINQFRQHPLDYLETFEKCIKKALGKLSNKAGQSVRGISVDATGSTPCPVDIDGTPLALLPQFSENPNAMFYLWKDHTAIEEALEITKVFSDCNGEDYTRFQGAYSSEWFWAKILYASRVDPIIKQYAYSWVEHCDWIPALLTGNLKPESMYRSSCAAGHKVLWHSDFGGLPARACFSRIDSYLAKVADTYKGPPQPSDTKVGIITKEWAKKLGISEQAVIGGSSLDAHAGAVGAGIKQGTLVKVLGTSTVDMLIERRENLRGNDLKDCCGQAEDSIVPGYVGIEAGQAAFGDVYSWFRRLLLQPITAMVEKSTYIADGDKKCFLQECYETVLSELDKAAMAEPCSEDLIIVDWFNGRRYPIINESVKGGIYGLSLGTDTAMLYKALVLSTIFGSRRIFDCFISRGIAIDDVIIVGGIAKKSAFVGQLLADILKRPVKVSGTEEACAKGAAIYASVACGAFSSITEAQKHLCDNFEKIFMPNDTKSPIYDKLYKQYLNFGRHIEQMENEIEK